MNEFKESEEHANNITLLVDISAAVGTEISTEDAEELLPYFDKRRASGLDLSTAFCFAYDDWKNDEM